MIYIGSHISSSKGYAAMGRQALKLGADTFGRSLDASYRKIHFRI